MVKGTTKSGFSYEIDEGILDDYEFLEILFKIDEGEVASSIKMVDMLLGKKQKERLKEHVRNEEGRVLASKMIVEAFEIFESIKKGKNC